MKHAAAMAALVLSLGMAGTCRAAAPASAASPASQAQPAASTAAGIPFKREPESTGSMAARTAAAWLVCLAVGGGVLYMLRRRLGLQPGLGLAKQRRLQVVESQRIGPKSSLVLVRWDQEELLLAQGEGGTSLLARAPAGRPSSNADVPTPGAA